MVDGWPFVLRIAGLYISSTGESAADYLRWLEQEPFKELGDGEHQEENAALLLRRSVDAVSDDARLALSVAGTLAFAPIACEPIAAALSEAVGVSVLPQGFCAKLKAIFFSRRTLSIQYSTDDERRAHKALGMLFNYGLLEKRKERWQLSHTLVHTYARAKIKLNMNNFVKLTLYYSDYIDRIHSAEEKNEKAKLEAYTTLDKEFRHLLILIEYCSRRELLEILNFFAIAILPYLEQCGHFSELQNVLTMNMTSAQRVQKPDIESFCRSQLIFYHMKYGNHIDALKYLERNLYVCQKIGDKKGSIMSLLNLGMIYNERSLCAKFFGHIQHTYGAKVLFGSDILFSGNVEATKESLPLNNINMYNEQEDFTKAFDCLRQALQLCQDIDHSEGEAQRLFTIGECYYKQDDLAKAEEYISQAVQIAEQVGYPLLEEWREELAQVRAKLQAAPCG